MAKVILHSRSGIVMNAYYDKAGGKNSYVDILLSPEGDGDSTVHLHNVPINRLWGISPSLPPVGSTAVVDFMDNNSNKPFVVAFFDSEITQDILEDDLTPTKPPIYLTR
jgi:hypothetical protein